MVADPELPTKPFPPGDPRYDKADYLAQRIHARLGRIERESPPGWGVVFAVLLSVLIGFALGRFA